MALPDPDSATSFPGTMSLTRWGWGAGVSLFVLVLAGSAAQAQSIPTPIRQWKAAAIFSLTEQLVNQMVRAGNLPTEPGLCPVMPTDLRLVRATYRDMSGDLYYGEVIVNRMIAEETASILFDLYVAGFPINRLSVAMSDDASMSLDNSSGFDCGKSARDGHAFTLKDYGLALDINPRENPFIRPRSPSALEEFLDMTKDSSANDPIKDAPLSERLGYFCGSSPEKCMIVPSEGISHLLRDGHAGEVVRSGPAFRIFSRYGWAWGGDWPQNRRDKIRSDYQRFERKPR